MSGLRRAVVRQFARPSGLPGRIAGWIMAHRPSNRRRNEWTVALLAPQPGERLLEIGCGPGYALAHCARTFPDASLTGLDHSPLMIATARGRMARHAPHADAGFEVGDVTWLAGQSARFDGIWSANVVQFLPDLGEAFEAVRAALAPGGRVVTTFQPRHKGATRDDALRKAAGIEAAMATLGFTAIRTEMLEMKPVPAVAVIGRKP